MSTPRNQRMFEAMPDQLRKLGGYAVDFAKALKAGGVVSATGSAFDGFDAAVIDLSNSVWATGNLRFIVIAEPAADINQTASMKTQSHAYGQFLDGSSRFHVMVEAPATHIDDLARFQRLVQQHILGQLGAPMKLWFSANGVEPAVAGFNGAVATTADQESDWLIPYGMTYPGGV